MQGVGQRLQVGRDGALGLGGGAQGGCVLGRRLGAGDGVRLALDQVGQLRLGGQHRLEVGGPGLLPQDVAQLPERRQHLLLGLSGCAIIATLEERLDACHVRNDEFLPAQGERAPQRRRPGGVLRLQQVRQLQQAALHLLHALACQGLLSAHSLGRRARRSHGQCREQSESDCRQCLHCLPRSSRMPC